MGIEELLFELTDALRSPVLVLVLLALVVALVELGALLAEVVRRRGRDVATLDLLIERAREALAEERPDDARSTLRAIAYSRWMQDVTDALVASHGAADAENRTAKRLAEFDLRSLRRLERTRMLVRFGPALGLMGTLIPLSPALAGLSSGDVEQLTENLRVAFGITVVGLFTGALAFAVSLTRDRLYAHDYSDLDYVSAQLAPERTPTPRPTS